MPDPVVPSYPFAGSSPFQLPEETAIAAFPLPRDTRPAEDLDGLIRDLERLRQTLIEDGTETAPLLPLDATDGAREEARLIARVRTNAESALARMINEMRALKEKAP